MPVRSELQLHRQLLGVLECIYCLERAAIILGARFRAVEAIDRMLGTTAKHKDRRKSQQSL